MNLLPYFHRMLSPGCHCLAPGCHWLCQCFALLIISLFATSITLAQTPTPTKPPREIFLPLDDLPVILEAETQRVFLTRKEYEELLATAKTSVERQPPLGHVLKSAAYSATLEPGRAVIKGTLTFDLLKDDLQLIPLQLSLVGVRSATLDDLPAPLARDPKLGVVLPVTGRGSHTLRLELTSPLVTSAAQQTLQLELPHAPAATFAVSVPGNVEVKSGAAVIRRRVDAEQNITHLELAMQRGPLALVMSLNNKQQAKNRIVISRGVMVDEVTAAYERIHATISLVVLHGAMDEAKLSLPAGFEVTSVESPLVSKWEVKKDELIVSFREPATETVTLNITASRYGPPRADWHFPRLTPLEMESQAFVLGLVLEDRWNSSGVTAKGLIPIDTAALTNAMPASVFAPGPGLPGIRPIVAYYAPLTLYDLQAKFERPAAEMFVTTSVFLTLRNAMHTAEVGLALQPRGEPSFTSEIIAPAGWLVQEVKQADGNSLLFERYPQPNGSTRVVVSFPTGITPGVVTQLSLKATSVPTGWLDTWTERKFTFPVFDVIGAARVEGAIALAAEDDLEIRPDQIAGLLPLTSSERQRYELGRSSTTLAYRHDGKLAAATFLAVRKQPSLTAEVYSFFRLKLGSLAAHYELAYDVREASTRELTFSLPAETPSEITIRGQGESTVKETSSSVKEGLRTWKVVLANRQRGWVKLAIDWEMRLASEEPKGFSLPLLKPLQVEFHSGFIAVEGDAELETEVVLHPRKVDEGELYAAEYQVGPRLVGAFGYLGETEVKIDVKRHPAHVLPSALTQRATLLTQLSATGMSQTAAVYALSTKAAFLEIELPAEAILWTITLDGRPTKPQRHDKRLLLSLPSGGEQSHRVNVVYQQQRRVLTSVGSLSLAAPRLLVRDTPESKSVEIPTADAEWTLLLPTGYELRRNSGTLETTLPSRQPAALKFLHWFGWMGREVSHKSLLGSDIFAIVDGDVGEVTMFDNPHAPASESTAAPMKSEELSAVDRSSIPLNDAIPESKPEIRIQQGMTLDDARKDLAKEGKDFKGKSNFMTPQLATRNDGILKDRETRSGAAETLKSELAEQMKAQIQAELWLPTGGEKGQTHLRLEGVAGLLIDVQREPNCAAFTLTSLGDSPRIEGLVVRFEPFALAGLAIGLLIFAWGCLQWKASLQQRAGFVIGVMVISTLAPLIVPQLGNDLGELFDGAFFGAALVGIGYLIAAWWRQISDCGQACRACCSRRIAWLLGNSAMVLIALSINSANAQTPPTNEVKPLALESILPLLADELRPVKVPNDAVIVPYDTADPKGVENAEKVLVPYAKYFQLWNLAHPEKKLPGPEPALPYGISTAQYSASLQTGESWEVRGTLEIMVWSDKPLAIPLPLAGGVLSFAELDGQTARLQIVMPEPVAPPQAAQNAAPAPPNEPLVLLHMQGAGRKKLAFTYRLPWSRQGSWRVATGTLPAIGGAGFAITPPNEPAEVRLNGFLDRNAFDTLQAKDEILTSLDFSGKFTLSWRPKVAEAMVDRGLAVKSQALFDVRQDVLRLTWIGDIEFPRSRRDRLTLQVPKEFLVERVIGANVRAWEVAEFGGQRQIEVTLLKEVAERESLSISLARYGTVGQGEMEIFRVPLVTVPGAELQQGKVLLRRDDLLDVRVSETQGLTREDADLDPALAQAADSYDSSLLPVKVFQAYRYVGLPVTIRLSAAPAVSTTEAETQMILNLGERSTSLEASVLVKPKNVPVHRVDILLPKELSEFEVEVPVAGGFEKSVTENQGRRQLTVLLRQGQTGDFPLLITGKLAPRDAEGKIAVPQIEVLQMARQQGTFVMQADPAYEVRVENMDGCESIPLASTFGWLQEQKRTNARSAVRWHTEKYSAQLRSVAKQPNIASQLLHNVKITPRTLEQTILAQYHVTEAGVREVTLLLPVALRNARVTARNVRRTQIEAEGNTVPTGFVRLRVELEDEFLGHYQVLLVHDRLLSTTAQTVQLPILDQGSGRRRLLMVESAGRDEVIVESTTSLEPLIRGQQAFTELTNALSAEPTQAYLAKTEVMDAALTFSLKQRESVDTAAARIGLAETLLVLDRSGAYRARQEYRVDNSSEQFLEVALPEQAALWTVTVDGHPAKPVQGTKGVVRIPIIRRARGDADYKVTLIYAGRMPKLDWWNQTRFPFPHTVNIHVERSVVRLMLPESYRWFGFDGSLGQPVDESGVQKTAQDYFRRQLDISREAINSGNKFEVARAQNSLQQIQGDLYGFNSSNSASYQNDADLSLRFTENGRALQEGLQQANEQLEENLQKETVDNRGRLSGLFDQQQLQRAKNVVGNETRNFNYDANQPSDASGGKKGLGLNSEWFEKNKLKNAPATKTLSRVASQPDKPSAGKPNANEPAQQQAQQPSFKRSGETKEPLMRERSDPQAKLDLQQGAIDEVREQAVNRYRSKLALQNAVPAAGPQATGGPAGGLGGNGLGGGGLPPPSVTLYNGQQPFTPPMPDLGTKAPHDGPGRGTVNQASQGYFEYNFDQLGDQGLASLVLEIPQRGAEYRFVTPRGELEITAQSVELNTLRGWITLSVALLVILAIYVVVRVICWLGKLHPLVGPLLIVFAGLTCVLLQVFTLWGWLAVIMGAIWLVKTYWSRFTPSNPATVTA